MTCTEFHRRRCEVSAAEALALLPPALAEWFATTFGTPTSVQRLAWHALRDAPHALVSAPTGTGKTLAALVPVLADWLTNPAADGWSDSPLRLLYVAPLKALVHDAARGIEQHWHDLSAFCPPGTALPRRAVRTGDSSPEERRLLRDAPPDILLTTPESLAVLLSLASSSSLFANLGWVVVDEVHALAGNKRGADLVVCLERLGQLTAGEPRRIGLSATATPLDLAARWLVGVDRPCAIVQGADRPAPRLLLEPLPEDAAFLGALADRLAAEAPRHRAVLVFTNTRGLAERLAWAMRRRLPAWDDRIAVHHSALAAARRREVESAFKQGQLRLVVSSTSLELGIDIGSVDLAVLVHPPGDVVRLLQRVGRAGHDPNGQRQGLVLTASAGELLEAAVTAASSRIGQCEPLTVAAAPLDVLCQQVLGMCAARPWPADELYALVRRSAPFADLSRSDFDGTLAYLRGLDRAGEAWLPPRLVEDGDCWSLAAGVARLLRRNLGSILAEPMLAVRLRLPEPADDVTGESLQTVGEIDESFADRLQPGDRFLLDGRCLEFRRRQPDEVVVEQVVGRPRVPQWTGEGWPLSSQLAQRLYLLRLQAAEALREGLPALQALFRDDYLLPPAGVELLATYFQHQECVSEIPDGQTLLVEQISVDRWVEYYLHTPLNRPGNDALARLLVTRLAREHGRAAVSTVADLGLVVRLRAELPEAAETLRRLLRLDDFDTDLDAALASSELLRSRFARVARIGLMLLRNPAGRRRRVGGGDWPERQLFEQIRQHDADFVLLRQALREVRSDWCDSQAARDYLGRLPLLSVRIRRLRRPSPFAAAWSQAEAGAADEARSPAEALARLHQELTGRAADAGAD